MKKLSFTFIILFLLLFSACEKSKDKSALVAEVNGEVLTLDAFKSTFNAEEWEALSPQLRRRYTEDWVNITLLAAEAEKQGLTQEPAFKQRLNYAQKKLKANALIAASLQDYQISEDELFSYFRIHQAEFLKPVLLYEIERLAFKDKISAENALLQLNSGLDFNNIFWNRISAELRPLSGKIGFIAPASADSLFWQKAQTIKINDYDILNKDEIWYVFRYTDTKEGESEASFEEHRAEIRRRILAEKQEEVYSDLLRRIKARQQNIYYY